MSRLLGFTTRTHKDPMHRSVYDGLRFAERERLVSRILPFLTITLTTGLSIYLFANRNHVYGGGYATFVQNDRVSAQAIVWICAYIAALLQIYVFQTAFDFALQLRLSFRGVNLQKFTLLSAVRRGGIELSLPFGLLFVTMITALAFIAPGIFWTGSLTPILLIGKPAPGLLNIPAYTTASKGLWDFEFPQSVKDIYMISTCQHLNDEQASITNCPVPMLQGSLLLSGASATPSRPGERIHPKLGTPAWTYTGRSYGVGSSVGLVDPTNTAQTSMQPDFFTYNETGYNIEIHCYKNPNSGVHIRLQKSDIPISTYLFSGGLPNEASNGLYELYSIPSFTSDTSNLCAWASRTNAQGTYASIASGSGNYSYLNTLECKMTFHPTIFAITANTTTNTITSTPITLPDIKPMDPDTTGRLVFNTIESLNLLSRISPTLYTSAIGDSLQSNVMNMASMLAAPAISDQIITSATEAYFQAIIDDILLAYSSSQLLIAQDIQSVNITTLSIGVKVGSWIFLLLNLILNSLLYMALIFEAIRTRFWRNLPLFNPSSPTHLITASSAGGAEFATAVAAAKDSRSIMLGIKESNFVDGMMAIGVPRVSDVMLMQVSREAEVRKSDDEAALVVRSPPSGRDGIRGEGGLLSVSRLGSKDGNGRSSDEHGRSWSRVSGWASSIGTAK